MQLYRYFEIEEINRFNSKSTEKNSKVAVLDQKYELPFEFIELELCKLFSCLPSQLEKENYNHLIKLLSLNNAYEEYKNLDREGGKARLEIKKKILKLERQLTENA